MRGAGRRCGRIKQSKIDQVPARVARSDKAARLGDVHADRGMAVDVAGKIAEVAADKVDQLCVQLDRIYARCPMMDGLHVGLDGADEDMNLIAPGQQRPHQIRSEKPRRSQHQHLHRAPHLSSPRPSLGESERRHYSPRGGGRTSGPKSEQQFERALHGPNIPTPVYMRLVDGVNTSVTWPEIQLRWAEDRTGSQALFLVGPEPDVKWRAFTAEAVALAGDFSVRLVVGLGGGSAIDTAKGVVWYGDEAASEPMMPHIAIPSTFSGAELTTIIEFFNSPTGQKYLDAQPRVVDATRSVFTASIPESMKQLTELLGAWGAPRQPPPNEEL